MSKSLMTEMEDILEQEVTARHSYFQLKYFVLGKEPTTQARMWQCLREIKSRRDSILAANLEVENTKDNLELLNIRIERLQTEKCEDELDTRENKIRIRKCERKKKALEASLVDIEEKKKWLEEEAQFFISAFNNLQKLEPLKPFDDLESQMEYWHLKLADKINLKLLFQQPLDTELVSTVLALPEGVPVKREMVSRLESIQKQMLTLREDARNQEKKQLE